MGKKYRVRFMVPGTSSFEIQWVKDVDAGDVLEAVQIAFRSIGATERPDFVEVDAKRIE